MTDELEGILSELKALKLERLQIAWETGGLFVEEKDIYWKLMEIVGRGAEGYSHWQVYMQKEDEKIAKDGVPHTMRELMALHRMPLETALAHGGMDEAIAALRLPAFGVLYVMSLHPGDRIKVGYTARSSEERLKEARTFVPEAQVIAEWPCESVLEFHIHRQLVESGLHRVGGSEVFSGVADFKEIVEDIEKWLGIFDQFGPENLTIAKLIRRLGTTMGASDCGK